MTFEELLALLGENAEAKALVEKMDSDNKNGVLAYNKKDRSALKYKKALQKLGYNAKDGKSADEFVVGLGEALATSGDEKTENGQLKKRITALEQSNIDKDATNDNLASTTKLSEAMGNTYIGKNLIIEELIRNGSVKQKDGKTVFVDGEDESAFDEGFKTLATTYAGHMVSEQISGAGTAADKKVVEGDLDDITLEDLGL